MARVRPKSTTDVETHDLIAREHNLIVRQVSDIGELLDLAAGRGAFVRALGHTPAWADAIETARGSAPPSLDAWLHRQGLAGVPWLLEWGHRAAVLIARHPAAAVPVDSIVLDEVGAPTPDTIGLLAALRFIDPRDTWSDDEVPPSPALERKGQFMPRMELAWDRRADALGATPRKRLKD